MKFMNANINLEEALQRASAGLRKKMLYSVELLRKAEKIAMNYDKDDGFFLAFSGGKDSQVLYHIAELGGVKFKAHMNLTSVDPPEVIRFVKKCYPDVELVKPKESIYSIAIRRKILPTMRVRWCCAEFKESAGAGKVTLIGIRHEESSRRSRRNEVEISSRKFSGTLDGLEEYRQEQKAKEARRKSKKDGVNIMNADQEQTLGCIHGKESLLISPIIHWTEKDVWEFLNQVVQVAHCELYDEGWRRLGCICCPMSSVNHKRMEELRWPHVKRNWIKAIEAIRNGGGYSRKNISGGTSEPTGDCGGAIIGSPNPRYVINRKWLQQPDQFLRVPIRQQRSLRQRQGHARLQDCIGFSEGSSSDRLTDEQENEIAENIYDWWTSGLGYRQWYAQKFLQLKLDFDAPPS